MYKTGNGILAKRNGQSYDKANLYGSVCSGSWLRKPADIGASANAYRCIRCKIINLQAARLLILQAQDY